MPGYPAPSQHILPPSPGPPPGGVGRKPPGPAPDRPARPHVRLSPLAFQHLLPLSYPCGSVPVCLVAPCVPVCVSPGPWEDHSEVAISSPLPLPRPCPQCYLSPFATVATATHLTASLDRAPCQGPLLSPTLPCKCPPATLTWFTLSRFLLLIKGLRIAGRGTVSLVGGWT